MSTNENHEVRVEKLTLEDGRHAERRTSVDHQGNEVVEIYAEEVKPLKLEKRIVREMKNVVARELHQTLENGQISTEEVIAVDGLQNHVVTKEDVAKLIQQAVSEVLANNVGCDHSKQKTVNKVLKAQEIVEKNVEEKKKNDNMINIILGGVILAQVLFFLGYMLLT